MLAGFLGIGGGAILAPFLGLLLGIDQHRAQGISLAALLPPVGLPAVLGYRRRGIAIDSRLVVLLIVGFVGGAVGGAWLAHRVPARELRWIFATYLIGSAIHAWVARVDEAKSPAADNHTKARLIAAIPIGAIGGAMSGLLGVGGGIIVLPLLRRFVGLSRLQAQATSLAMMLPPIGLPAVWVYATEQGGLPWPLLVAVALGFGIGAGVGARLAGRASAKVSTRVFAGLSVVVAGILLTKN